MATQVILQFNHLPEFARSVGAAARDIVAKVGHDIEADSKASMVGGGSPHVPSAPGQPPHVDTGNLRNSIRFGLTGEASGEVAVGAEYAEFLEFGTSRMAPRPFMTPAVDRVAGKLEAIGAELVRRTLP